MVAEFLQWFMKEPLKNFLLIFGGGGILAVIFRWWSAWNNRRKVEVRSLVETFDTKTDPNIEVDLSFEVTNLGEKTTALKPSIIVKSIMPKRERRKFTLEVQEADRMLPPHTPKTFTAKATVGTVYLFCWYKKYKFELTKGSGGIIRYRNAKNEDMSFLKYWHEYLLFRYFGKVVKSA